MRGLEALIGPVACDVVGFSFGGQVAGFMADQFPQRVRRLVIVGAPGMGLYQRGRIVLKGWRHLSSPAARDAVHRYNLQALMLWRPDAVDDLAVAIQAANTVRDRMQRRKLSGTDALGQALGRLTRPWRAIYGAHDALYSESMDDLLRILRAKPGFTGMEMGRRFPNDPKVMLPILKAADVTLCGGWFSGTLANEEMSANKDRIRPMIELFKAVDAPCIVYGEVGRSIQGDRSKPLAGKAVLSDDEMKTIVDFMVAKSE